MTDEHKIQLNLNEDNEIGFKVKIEGRSNDVVGSKTMIRFTITESETGKGWIFDTTKPQGQEDGVLVSIPSMKGLVTENKKYNGKLEVILGPHYFTPTEVDIEFIEPLKVEAAMFVNKSSASQKQLNEEKEKPVTKAEPVLRVESGVINVKTNAQVASKPKAALPASSQQEELVQIKKNIDKKYSQLNSEEKKKVNEIFISICESKGISEPHKILSEGNTAMKIVVRKQLQSALDIFNK
jgi:hypothetical protein